MWEMIGRHLPTFGQILASGIILGSLLIGIVDPVDEVCGEDIGFLKTIGWVIISISVGSVVGGLIWLLFAKYTTIVSETNIRIGLLIGGLLTGIGILLYAQSRIVEKDVSETVGWIAGMTAGVIAGGITGGIAGIIAGLIVGGIVGGIVDGIAGWIVGGIAGWITGVITSVIAGMIATLSSLLSKPFSMFLTPTLILLIHRKKS